MTKKKDAKRRIMKEFVISEISAVDRPAQEGARAVIVKRADFDEELEKAQGRHPAGHPQGGQFAPGSMNGGRGGVFGGSIRQDPQSGLWESTDKKGKRKLHRSKGEATRFLSAVHEDRPITFGPSPRGGVAVGKSETTNEVTFTVDGVQKRLRLTTADDGHAHLVDDSLEGGNTSYEKAEGDEYGHSHPFVRHFDGTIEIGESSGHTHSIVMLKAKAKDDGDGKELDDEDTAPRGLDDEDADSADDEIGYDEDDMDEKTKKVAADNDVAALQKGLDAAKAENARLAKMLELDDSERAFMKAMPKDQQDAFLNASVQDRATAVKKAKEGDEVVYKTDDGREFRKSDDPRLVAMAKQHDDTARELKKAREEQAASNFAKRAQEEIPHLPGTATERGALLKAIEAMPQEQRASALAAVKAGSAAMSGTFKRHGSADAGATVDESNPNAFLEAKAREYAKAKSVSYFDAYAVVKNDYPEVYAKAVSGTSAPTTQVVGG